MTPEERADRINLACPCGDINVARVRAEITKAIRAAVEEEREACAKTLEAMCGDGAICAEACPRCRGLRRGADEIRARAK